MNYSDNPNNLCPGCGREIPDREIKRHIQSCQKYPISPMYRQLVRMDRTTPPNVLKFLSMELEMMQQKIRELMPELIEQEDFSGVIDIEDHQYEKPDFKSNRMIAEQSHIPDLAVYGARIVVCMSCSNKFYENFDRDILFTIFNCWHIFCLPCINKYVNSQFVNSGGELKCLKTDCNEIMPEQQLRGLMGQEKYENQYQKALRKKFNLVSCFKCHDQYEFIQGNPKDAPKKDPQNNDLMQQHRRDYAINRIVCSRASCKTQQCRSCNAIPYHLGMTCKQYKDRSLMKKCRYCDDPLTEKNIALGSHKALADICKKSQCQDNAKHACTKVHPCGHTCHGFRNQKNCLPCLDQKCAEQNPELMGVKGDDYCSICYTEALSASPCVRSSCGHIFHLKCLKKRFQVRWLTARIFLHFCLCPLCKKWITLAPECQLYKLSDNFSQLFQKIQNMSIERLKFEQLQKTDPKLKDKTSPYYGKPKQYAMAIYAYFQCYKCKKPYFGGRKDCMAAMNQQQAGGNFDAKQLVCANCCQIPIENCPKHGKEYIQFKCKFCCNVAQWFCWGNTHFCQPCHKRQCNGDYVSKYTKDQLPKCLGPGKCPIGGNHSGNGQQKMLGCAVCRNFKENQKAF